MGDETIIVAAPPVEKVTVVDEECGGFGINCVGPNNPCFESRREVATKWTYVGEGRGGYSVVNEFAYVGEDRGSFNPEEVVTYQSCRPRLWFVCCFFGMIIVALSVALVMMKGSWKHITIRHVDPYVCVAAGGTGSPIVRALIDAAWRCADADGDGRISSAELQGCQDLSPAIFQKLSGGDVNGDSSLSRLEFEQALADSGSYVHGYWQVADQDLDQQVTPQELQSAQQQQLLPAGLIAPLLRADQDADGTLNYDEFMGAAGGSASRGGGGKQLAKVAWLIADKDSDGFLSRDRLMRLADWASISPAVMLQLIPNQGSVLQKDDFISVMAGLPIELWSPSQQVWCCTYRGVCAATTAMPETTAIRTTVHLRYNCHDSYDSWWKDWVPEKQDWCCEHFGRACPVTRPPPRPVVLSEPFDCTAGYSNWQKGWSERKKYWCCRHYHRGCQPFDCDVHAATWVADWSPEKKAWCCQHDGRGCKMPTTSPPFDCHAGYSNWQKGWSSAKKAWCCEHWHRGCPQEKELFDCSAGYSNWRAGWSQPKKDWCCNHEQKGCTNGVRIEGSGSHHHYEHHSHEGRRVDGGAVVVRGPEGHVAGGAVAVRGGGAYAQSSDNYDWYDCSVGLSEWRSRWSAVKKAWCCHHQQKGCSSDAGSLEYNCSAGLSNWKDDWSDSKKVWCCRHYKRGCQYDCSAGYARWRDGWSDDKKAWCCQHKQRGCSESETPSFDCSAGLDKWREGWSPQKQEWCCKHEHRGCPDSHDVDAYDCSAAYDNWREVWSSTKKDWCCRHKKRGCLYDCRAGLSKWKDGWSRHKKQWCCRHSGLGCQKS
eukprot:TRINITY_DN105406_c0_g1_i1.p1 TRINITY_DN105406_c0_g1~~TRINITY_DN105406_c0_g1_i1.p1  ORF type:complete len:821 (+),score=119.82 TRINITY_DN105406_c0_g1_i1:108-2570(+)